MLRYEAINILKRRVSEKPMNEWARILGVTIRKNGKINKGWVGLTLNKLIKSDSSDFTIKSVHGTVSCNTFVPGDTLAVSMINQQELIQTDFHSSSLLSKIERLILIPHQYTDEERTNTRVVAVVPFDLSDRSLISNIEKDYKKISSTFSEGDAPATPTVTGNFLQMRTKGNRKDLNLTTDIVTGGLYSRRAFYLNKQFIKYAIGAL